MPSRRVRWTFAVKRVVDFLAATVGLIVLSPVFVLIGLLIKLDSRGPVLFKQARLGQNGRQFDVWKFRTMCVNAEELLEEILDEDRVRRAEYETFHKLRDDPRVTRVGRWLRRLSLDELPQLMNVVAGEMSLVGPRAYLPSERPKMLGLENIVLQAKPGITGVWQVSGRNGVSFTERVRMDVHYVLNPSALRDIRILGRTLPVVLSGRGAN